MYSTYQQYQQRGGKLPENEYQANSQKASELIDYENVDGYSVSFSGQAEARAGLLSVMKRHLSFPANLLVFSGWSFV